MKPEKRDAIMAKFMADFEGSHRLTLDDPVKEAIVECYRRAKAWDELRAWAGSQTFTDRTCAKMDELIPPEPGDNLEKLKRWLSGFSYQSAISVMYVCSKIKELQDEDR